MTASVRQILLDILTRLTGLEPTEIRPDLPLLEEGLLTSLQVVELVTRLEQGTGVVLSDQDVTPENFATLAAMETLVESRRKGAQD